MMSMHSMKTHLRAGRRIRRPADLVGRGF